MTRRGFFLVWSLLIAASPALAQSRSAPIDAITGSWSGVFRIGDRNLEVILALKLDAKGGVTGTLSGFPNPADVKRGNFDVKTGALQLHVGMAKENAVLIVMEGVVAKNRATGTLDTEDGPGRFEIARKE